MPVIQIKSLPQDNGIDTRVILKKICCRVADDLKVPKHQVWGTWEILASGNYVEGDSAPPLQPKATHPPIVNVIAFEGRSQNQINGMLRVIADELCQELKMNSGNAFITFTEAHSGRVYTGGELRFRKESFERTFSGAPWEARVGYCRAVKAGNHIFVTGTAPVDDKGNVISPGNPYAQAKHCFEIIENALIRLGSDRKSVVRTRMFVTDISKWEAFGEAHREHFGEHPPATTMVEVKSLIDPKMLIEIEADAVVSQSAEPATGGN